MRLHNIIGILTLSALSYACGGSDGDDPSAMAGSVLSFTSVDTSATSTLNQGDKVGLTLWDATSGQTYYLNQQGVVAENGQLVGAESLTFPEGASSLSVFAYTPYRSDWNSNVSYRRVEVLSDQSSYSNFHASDFQVGLPMEGNPITSTNVKLEFRHVMSRINVELTDPSEEVKISQAAIKITNILTAVFVNPYTGDVSPIDGQTGSVLTYRTLGTDLTRSNRRETMAAIIPVQTIPAGTVFIEINIDSQKYKFALPDTIELEQGSEYNYALELTGDVITLISSSVTNWTTNPVTDLYVDLDDCS